MRKFQLLFIVLICTTFIATPVLAGSKPPKSLCATIDGTEMVLLLGTKSSGVKIKTVDGNTKFYHVQGAIMEGTGGHNAVTGSGFIGDVRGGQAWLYADLHGDFIGGNIYNMELYWESNGGGGSVNIDFGDSTEQTTHNLTEVDCSTLDIVWPKT